MGCGASTASTKQAIASAEFSTNKSWSGIASVSGMLMGVKTGKKGAGQLQDAAGTVLLNIVPSVGKAYDACFNEPATGKTVVLVCLNQMGNTFTGKATEWGIWTAEDSAQTGQPPETTPTGQSMYKFGSLRVPVRLKPTMEYLDPSGKKLFSAKMISTGCSSFAVVLCDGTDGSSPAAVVDGLGNGTVEETWKVTCTFAKGVDPVVAIIMAVQWMGIAGGA